MSLSLVGTRDHALLALVVKEAQPIVQTEGFLGRTAVQKIMYFLRVLGVPMGYNFELYHYGPFCAEILTDLEWLIADNVIKDVSPEQRRYSNYQTDKNIDELLDSHTEELVPVRDSVCEIVKALSPLRPERLELFATLDYLYRQKKATGWKVQFKGWVVEKFLFFKGDKFPREDVERAYDMMANIELLER